ncbi:hypothetical protein D3C73_1527650 [compost metagenome]
MPGNNGAICSEIIYIAVAVDVPEMSALCSLHKYGRSAAYRFERAGGTVDAAYNMLQCFFIQML